MKYLLTVMILLAGCTSGTLEERAEQGDTDAIIELAGLYFEGSDGRAQDLTKARHLLMPLADRADARANHFLGLIAYFEGDPEDALDRFENAASHDYVPARYMAAQLYLQGTCSSDRAAKAFDHLDSAVRRLESDPALRREYRQGGLDVELEMRSFLEGLVRANSEGTLDESSIACFEEASRRGYIKASPQL